MNSYDKIISDARQAVTDLRRQLRVSASASISIPEQLPEQIPPTDEPIDRASALLNYAVAVLLARPHLDHDELLSRLDDMDGSITSYLGQLDYAADPVISRMETLQSHLDLDYQDLVDEDDEGFSPEDAKRNAKLLKRIARNEAELATLKPKADFYKRADLRHFLAHTINRLLHKHRDLSDETLIRRSLKAHLTR